jgi:hypothetical protein
MKGKRHTVEGGWKEEWCSERETDLLRKEDVWIVKNRTRMKRRRGERVL